MTAQRYREVNNDKHITFRNSIIGPDLKKDGIGLFNWFMQQKVPSMAIRVLFGRE